MTHYFSNWARPSHFAVVYIRLILLVGVFFLIWLTNFFQTPSKTQDSNARAATLEELPSPTFVPYNINIRSFYEQQSGFGTLPVGNSSTPDSFGAYFLLPVEDSLYLALGQYPARADGALVATLNASSMSLQKIPMTNTAGNRIEEQGIHLLVVDQSNNSVIFPGTDPMDSWALGNFYAIDINLKLGTKHRNSAGLTEVVHGWGLTVSPEGNYYYGTGSNITSVPYTTSAVAVGEVFKSSDKGLSWSRITIDPSQATSITSFLSPFRIYSLAWLNNRLYAASSDSSIWYTANEGASWEVLSGFNVDPVLTPIKLNQGTVSQEFILATTQDGRFIRRINPDNSTDVFLVPFKIITGGYRHGKMTTDGEWVYVLTEDLVTQQNSVYRSRDLSNWYLVNSLPAYNTVTGGKAVTLAFWPNRGEIIVATDGAEAKLYAISVSSIPPYDTTPTPTQLPSATPVPTLQPTFTPTPTPTQTPTATPTPPTCQANPDINGSGTVDMFDTSILISALMIEGSNLPADLNCDGVVNLRDFSILVSNLRL